MGLLIDRRTSELRDWIAYDSKLIELLEEDNGGLGAKGILAQEIVESEMLELLIRQVGSSPMGARQQLRAIVVGPELKRWHGFTTLQLFYADLAARAVNSAHAAQAVYFERLSAQAKTHLLSTGIGYVTNPLPAPTTPPLRSIQAFGPERTLRAKIAFEGPNSTHSGGSELFILDIAAGHSVAIGPVSVPNGATGWNLYIGSSEEELRLVNTSPLGSSEVIELNAAQPSVDAPAAPPLGQVAEAFWLINHTLWR